jgi:hypothetical protein
MNSYPEFECLCLADRLRIAALEAEWHGLACRFLTAIKEAADILDEQQYPDNCHSSEPQRHPPP